MEWVVLEQWESLGGGIKDAPAIASLGTNQLDVFVRGEEDALWNKSWNGSSWSYWEKIESGLSSSPFAISRGAKYMYVFVRGANTHVYSLKIK